MKQSKRIVFYKHKNECKSEHEYMNLDRICIEALARQAEDL